MSQKRKPPERIFEVVSLSSWHRDGRPMFVGLFVNDWVKLPHFSVSVLVGVDPYDPKSRGGV